MKELNNQSVKNRSLVAQQALAQMRSALDKSKRASARLPHRALRIPADDVGLAVNAPREHIGRLLLTPRQAEGVDVVQRLCGVVHRAVRQINTVLVVHELEVPPIYLVEVTELLRSLDGKVSAARIAADRLGIEAVQPKVRLSGLNKSEANK